ncbi:MAG: glucose-6-phosphate dehydrogenase [Saprospiraceae bacterium]|nr:glucose-6-phosphate dehydrogenase [Saprospiraceae bacterium]
MKNYNPAIHHRVSIRLKGFDYAQSGFYFVTIRTQGRALLFGKITNGIMHLNEAGKFVDECWLAIPDHYPKVILHNHVIMPNHVHGIVEFIKTITNPRYPKPEYRRGD